MKYFSLIFILVIMHLSWAYVHKPPALPEVIHFELQEDIKDLISDAIALQLPTAQSLVFDRFWTELINENQIKATFSYRFSDADPEMGEVQIGVSGQAILNYMPEGDEGPGNWGLDELNVTDTQILYIEGAEILPEELSEQ